MVLFVLVFFINLMRFFLIFFLEKFRYFLLIFFLGLFVILNFVDKYLFNILFKVSDDKVGYFFIILFNKIFC